MSIGHKAVRGAAWTILSSVGGRVIGVVATLVLTRYIAKADYDDVSAVASAIVITVDELTRFGIFNYIVAKPASGAIAAWHCTVYHLGIGLPALAAVVVFRRQIVPFFGSKGAVKYIPGMAAVLAIERIATGPERILARDLRFRTIAASSSAAQFLYAALGVVLAMQNFGGYAIVADAERLPAALPAIYRSLVR